MAEKRSTKSNSKASSKKTDIQKVLIENFVSLQKVMTTLSLRFDKLSTQIEKLLAVFELSAKIIMKIT